MEEYTSPKEFIELSSTSSSNRLSSLSIANTLSTNIESTPINEPKYKIGRNIVCKCNNNKYVFGLSNSLCLMISIHLAILATVLGWIITNNYFYHPIIYCIGLLTYFICAYQMCMCFFVEPGIIPKQHKDYQANDDEIQTLTDKDNNNTSNRDIIKNNKTPKIYTKRYCKTCKIMKPSKASHCSICDNCILEFDQ